MVACATTPGCRAFSSHLGYSSVCDRQRKATPPSLPESSKEAWQLEREHVHRVYDLIARHFSSTRHSPWPRIVEFLKALPSGSIVADIGCGNGKYLGINKELYMASNSCSCFFNLKKMGGGSYMHTVFNIIFIPSSPNFSSSYVSFPL